ncbi:hypothetical protein AA101099_0862 [Neoasaia chiangmaiensis NBRC 101099]|nr:hypothetical protein AA101099_0862 [Neoasaia chiangmaiensis NBRC 101099]
MGMRPICPCAIAEQEMDMTGWREMTGLSNEKAMCSRFDHTRRNKEACTAGAQIRLNTSQNPPWRII